MTVAAPSVAPDALLDQAAATLRAGDLVAIPTETVYGLAADASNPQAVGKIFALKGRPADHPVIVHIAGKEQLSDWAREAPDAAWRLAEAFWPGPLTLILPRQAHVSDAVTGGQDTVGLRAPAHPTTQALLQRFGGGLAAPSANRFGQVSPTQAEHVRAEFGADCPLLLDGGPCLIGVESTIVSLMGDEAKLLRPGGVPREAIETLLGKPLTHHQHASTAKVRVSGLLDSHYAPRTPLLLGQRAELLQYAEQQQAAGNAIAILSLGPLVVPAGCHALSMPTDAKRYAQQLYASLRQLDQGGFHCLLLEAPPQQAAWLAVNDRLRRAASGSIRQAS